MRKVFCTLFVLLSIPLSVAFAQRSPAVSPILEIEVQEQDTNLVKAKGYNFSNPSDKLIATQDRKTKESEGTPLPMLIFLLVLPAMIWFGMMYKLKASRDEKESFPDNVTKLPERVEEEKNPSEDFKKAS